MNQINLDEIGIRRNESWNSWRRKKHGKPTGLLRIPISRFGDHPTFHFRRRRKYSGDPQNSPVVHQRPATLSLYMDISKRTTSSVESTTWNIGTKSPHFSNCGHEIRVYKSPWKLRSSSFTWIYSVIFQYRTTFLAVTHQTTHGTNNSYLWVQLRVREHKNIPPFCRRWEHQGPSLSGLYWSSEDIHKRSTLSVELQASKWQHTLNV